MEWDVISNEPGIYCDFKTKLKGRSYDQAIVIRFEVNFLIQNKGFKNLSTGCPKTIEELEHLLAQGRRSNKQIQF